VTDLTPESARDLGNALARYLNQHDVTTGRAVERERVSKSGTPAERAMWEGLDGGRDQRDLWQVRFEAEAKISAIALAPKLNGLYEPSLPERLSSDSLQCMTVYDFTGQPLAHQVLPNTKAADGHSSTTATPVDTHLSILDRLEAEASRLDSCNFHYIQDEERAEAARDVMRDAAEEIKRLQSGMDERLVQTDMDVSKANRRASELERDLEIAQARLARGLGAAAFERALSLICQPQRTRDGALSWSQPSEEQMRYVHAWVGFVAEKCMPEAVEETVTPRVVQAVKKTTESTRQVSLVSSDGTVLLPQRIRERLEVGQGGEVAFLTNHLTGRVEVLSERDFLDLLGPDPGSNSIAEPTAKQIASLARGMYEAYAAELGWRKPDDHELLRRWSVKDVIAVGEPLIFGGPKAYAMDDGSSAGESEKNAWHRLAIEARGLNLIGGTEMTRELATRLYLVYVDYLGGVSTYAPHEPLVPWDDLFEISQRAWLKAVLYARDHVRCTCPHCQLYLPAS
jgi:bifunctional DNA-binding transcriptional regulator/antitoxin component of YhaV-PrlF toxin-antitoxin module